MKVNEVKLDLVNQFLHEVALRMYNLSDIDSVMLSLKYYNVQKDNFLDLIPAAVERPSFPAKFEIKMLAEEFLPVEINSSMLSTMVIRIEENTKDSLSGLLNFLMSLKTISDALSETDLIDNVEYDLDIAILYKDKSFSVLHLEDENSEYIYHRFPESRFK